MAEPIKPKVGVKSPTNNLKKEDVAYVKELTNSIKYGLKSINLSLAAAKEPLHTVDFVVTKLTNLGKDELADKAINIVNSISSDLKLYGKEISNYSQEVASHLDKTPTRRRHMDAFIANSIYLGQCLLDLNSRIVQTTMVIVNDYAVILTAAEEEVTK